MFWSGLGKSFFQVAFSSFLLEAALAKEWMSNLESKTV